MRRPSLTEKKIRLILDTLVLMGWCAGVDDDWLESGHTNQERKDYHEALDFMRRLLWWNEWKQEQREGNNANTSNKNKTA